MFGVMTNVDRHFVTMTISHYHTCINHAHVFFNDCRAAYDKCDGLTSSSGIVANMIAWEREKGVLGSDVTHVVYRVLKNEFIIK
jgi:hypothetical protein